MAQTVLKALNQGLQEAMEQNERVLMIGEDILDPYGGAFKVTKGLSTKFPERVWTTPLSEAGFVGVAVGMAVRGLLPVVEIMFGDFIALAADQLVNHAAKFRWMYGDKVDVPIVVRTPMGGRRGYGPTHSQSLEKHFLGVPGLAVVAVHPVGQPGELLKRAILEDRRPLLFVENKTMYARRVLEIEDGTVGAWRARVSEDPYPTTTLSLSDFEVGDVTIVAYGGMVELAMEAAEQLLIEEEIYAEVVAPISLQPLYEEPILESVRRTGRLVACEEGSEAGGIGAEICALVTDQSFRALQAPPRRVAARPIPIGNAPELEGAILPGVENVMETVKSVLPGRPKLQLLTG